LLITYFLDVDYLWVKEIGLGVVCLLRDGFYTDLPLETYFLVV